MKPDKLDRKIQAAQERLRRLLQRQDTKPTRQPQTATKAIQEFSIALEELRAISEEIRQRDEQLAVAEQRVAAERQALFELAPEGCLVTDVDAVIRETNRAADALLKASKKDDVIGTSLKVFVPNGERKTFLDHLACLRKRRVVERWETSLQPRTGEPVRIAVAVAPGLPLEERDKTLRWLLQDITGRKRMESRLAIQYAVARVLGEASMLAEVMPKLLQAVGESMGWDVGVFWVVDESAGVLRCAEVWGKEPAEATRAFAEELRTLTLPSGVGLPGQVWATGELAWLSDVAHAPDCPVAPLAFRSGLHGVFAFPLRAGNVTTGVMEYLSREICQPWRDLLDMLAALGGQIGQFMERKRAEDELRETHTALAHAVEGISRLDAQGRFLAVNAAYAGMLGYTPEELIGAGWEQSIHPDDRAAVEAVYQQMLSVGKSQVEVRALRKDGSVFHKRVVMIKANEGEGSFAGHYSFMADITEVKLAQERLRESEARFRELAETIQEVFWVSTPDKSEVIYISPGYEKLWGRTCENLYAEPRSWLDAICPEDRDRVLEAALTKQLSGEYCEEYRIVQPDGAVRWVLDRAFPVRDRSGQVCRIVGLAQDITERKQAEGKLSFYREVIAHSSEAIAVLDLQCRYLEQNGAHRLLTGYSNGELLGKTLAWHLGEEVFSAILPEMGRVGLYKGACTIRTKDGRAVDIELAIFSVRNEAGEPVCYVEIEHDVTDRKEMERQLKQAEKMVMLGTLIAGVSHELNNPLFALSGFVELARMKVQKGHYEGLAEDMAAITECADRTAAIVQRFLGVARSDKRYCEPCSVNGILERGLELVANDLFIHKIAVEKNFSPDLPLVQADPQELIQVFLNLFTNARQAMVPAHERGTLRVTTSFVADAAIRGRGDQGKGRKGGAKAGWVEVRIQDDGSGIAPEHLARMFDPFFTTKAVGEGTGLGLFLCHRIVTDLGGAITCQSAQGQGATFVVKLPAVGE
nr:PAS domain S-box protein [Nitrospirota bacterium]